MSKYCRRKMGSSYNGRRNQGAAQPKTPNKPKGNQVNLFRNQPKGKIPTKGKYMKNQNFFV